jgi:hypothetical protein
MYIKIANGQPEIYTIGQLRRDNPGTSFPKNPTDALLAEWGMYPYTRPERPVANDPLTTKIVDGSFEQDSVGNWVLPYVVEQLPQVEAENKIRSKRNSLLVSSDWTQVVDAPVDQTAWATYRQQLRDITDQEGFPYSVTWPTEPSA